MCIRDREDNCVTLRKRDTMQQERVAISELNNIIADRVTFDIKSKVTRKINLPLEEGGYIPRIRFTQA